MLGHSQPAGAASTRGRESCGIHMGCCVGDTVDMPGIIDTALEIDTSDNKDGDDSLSRSPTMTSPIAEDDVDDDEAARNDEFKALWREKSLPPPHCDCFRLQVLNAIIKRLKAKAKQASEDKDALAPEEVQIRITALNKELQVLQLEGGSLNKLNRTREACLSPHITTFCLFSC